MNRLPITIVVDRRTILCGVVSWLAGGCSRTESKAPPKKIVAEEEKQGKSEESQPSRKIDPEVVTPITYEDLHIALEPDSVFEDYMLTQRVRDLEGCLVKITGFMCGAIFQLNNVRDFPLMREKECPYGPGGEAHHVIAVEIRRGKPLTFSTRPVTVEGRLRVSPFTGPNGKTWSLYKLENAKSIEG